MSEATDTMSGFFGLTSRDLPDLKFCMKCGMYRTRSLGYWERHAMRQMWMVAGRTASRWRRIVPQVGIERLVRWWVCEDEEAMTRADWLGRV
jgi:hypothetical protein